ncbi:ribonuclease H-like domain, reverse transcriptase, RNA-dependent DNA polymerase [Tanacetum coccineum]
MRSNLKVVDNSRAKRVMCIQALKGMKGARLGDTIVASVKEAQLGGKVKKGQVVYGMVVQAAMQKGRCDGSEVKFDDHAVVLVNKQAYCMRYESFYACCFHPFLPVAQDTSNKIYGYSDSSYGVNTQEGKGTTDIIFYYGESPISWSTQKQATVALSSCESEFIAATAAQALWLKRLLSRLTHSEEEKITILVDNKSAIALMKNPVFHGRSKHIDTKYHFIRECVERDDIQLIGLKDLQGHTFDDSTLDQTITAVPDRYLQIVASIEQYSDLGEMSLEEAIGRLKAYEERIKFKKGKQVNDQEKLMFTHIDTEERI